MKIRESLPAGFIQEAQEDPSRDQRIPMCAMPILCLDPEVPGHYVEVTPTKPRKEAPRHSNRAKALNLRYFARRLSQLTTHEPPIEADVVGDENSALEAFQDIRRDLVEVRCVGDHVIVDAGECDDRRRN